MFNKKRGQIFFLFYVGARAPESEERVRKVGRVGMLSV
jgi:hypothetical protein